MMNSMMDKDRYIQLLKMVLIDLHHVEYGEYKPLYGHFMWRVKLVRAINSLISSADIAICKKIEPNMQKRIEGRDWPGYADTMIGLKRIENLEFCINQILKDNVPGDFIETGVWRGGASIFMKALLEVNDDHERVVWLADSFEGLPKPDVKNYKADKGDKHFAMKELAVSLETVKNNFSKYNLLDDNVKFLKGWFKDTLPVAPIEKLSLVRLDGDMYESTMDGIVNLYPKLSVGGYLIVDDWGAVQGCKDAIIDYRTKHNITEEIIPIDWAGVYWRRER